MRHNLYRIYQLEISYVAVCTFWCVIAADINGSMVKGIWRHSPHSKSANDAEITGQHLPGALLNMGWLRCLLKAVVPKKELWSGNTLHVRELVQDIHWMLCDARVDVGKSNPYVLWPLPRALLLAVHYCGKGSWACKHVCQFMECTWDNLQYSCPMNTL